MSQGWHSYLQPPLCRKLTGKGAQKSASSLHATVMSSLKKKIMKTELKTPIYPNIRATFSLTMHSFLGEKNRT